MQGPKTLYKMSKRLFKKSSLTFAEVSWPLAHVEVLYISQRPENPLQKSRISLWLSLSLYLLPPLFYHKGTVPRFRFPVPVRFLSRAKKAHKHEETHRTSPVSDPTLTFFIWGAPSSWKISEKGPPTYKEFMATLSEVSKRGWRTEGVGPRKSFICQRFRPLSVPFSRGDTFLENFLGSFRGFVCRQPPPANF